MDLPCLVLPIISVLPPFRERFRFIDPSFTSMSTEHQQHLPLLPSQVVSLPGTAPNTSSSMYRPLAPSTSMPQHHPLAPSTSMPQYRPLAPRTYRLHGANVTQSPTNIAGTGNNNTGLCAGPSPHPINRSGLFTEITTSSHVDNMSVSRIADISNLPDVDMDSSLGINTGYSADDSFAPWKISHLDSLLKFEKQLHGITRSSLVTSQSCSQA